MKRRTLWIIGVATAVVTAVSLNAVFGSRYLMHNRNHHWCMQERNDGEGKSKPDSTNWR